MPTGEQSKAGGSMPEKKPRAKYNKGGMIRRRPVGLAVWGAPHGWSAVGPGPVLHALASPLQAHAM